MYFHFSILFKNSNLYCLGTLVSLWNTLWRQILGYNRFIPLVRLRTRDPNMGFSDFTISFCWFYKIHNNMAILPGHGMVQGSRARAVEALALLQEQKWAQIPSCSWRGLLAALHTSKAKTPLHWPTQIEAFVFLNLSAHLGKFIEEK